MFCLVHLIIAAICYCRYNVHGETQYPACSSDMCATSFDAKTLCSLTRQNSSSLLIDDVTITNNGHIFGKKSICIPKRLFSLMSKACNNGNDSSCDASVTSLVRKTCCESGVRIKLFYYCIRQEAIFTTCEQSHKNPLPIEVKHIVAFSKKGKSNFCQWGVDIPDSKSMTISVQYLRKSDPGQCTRKRSSLSIQYITATGTPYLPLLPVCSTRRDNVTLSIPSSAKRAIIWFTPKKVGERLWLSYSFISPLLASVREFGPPPNATGCLDDIADGNTDGNEYGTLIDDTAKTGQAHSVPEAGCVFRAVWIGSLSAVSMLVVFFAAIAIVLFIKLYRAHFHGIDFAKLRSSRDRSPLVTIELSSNGPYSVTTSTYAEPYEPPMMDSLPENVCSKRTPLSGSIRLGTSSYPDHCMTLPNGNVTNEIPSVIGRNRNNTMTNFESLHKTPSERNAARVELESPHMNFVQYAMPYKRKPSVGREMSEDHEQANNQHPQMSFRTSIEQAKSAKELQLLMGVSAPNSPTEIIHQAADNWFGPSMQFSQRDITDNEAEMSPQSLLNLTWPDEMIDNPMYESIRDPIDNY